MNSLPGYFPSFQHLSTSQDLFHKVYGAGKSRKNEMTPISALALDDICFYHLHDSIWAILSICLKDMKVL